MFINFLTQPEQISKILAPADDLEPLDKVSDIFARLLSLRSKMVKQQLEKVNIDTKEPSLLSESNPSLADSIYQFMLNFTEEISMRYFFWLQES